MLTSKSIQRVEIPNESGEWAEIKPLSFAERTEAEEVYSDRAMKKALALSPDGLQAIKDVIGKAEEESPQAVKQAEAIVAEAAANPLASLDVRTVLIHGLKKLSYDGGIAVTPSIVDDLDAASAEAMATLIVGLSRRMVEEGKGSSKTRPSSSGTSGGHSPQS